MKEFLESVLPSEGYYAALAISNGRIRQRFFTKIEDMVSYSRVMDKENDVYYAVGSFAEMGKRTQDNVLLKKAFYVDIDCGQGKPYATQEEGCIALAKFVKTGGLPKPTILSSGRGIHAYWVLTEAIPSVPWQKVANRLKALSEKLGFHADPAVTADSARVLRAVDTTNKKCGKLVSVLMKGSPVDVLTFAKALAAHDLARYLTVEPAPQTTHRSQRPDLLSAMSAEQEYPLCDSFVIEQKCAAISFAIKHPNEVSEPFWYKMMGLAAYCVDPEETAIRWSQGYDGFDPDMTVRKMLQFKESTSGAPLCESFARDCKECKDCPFRAKGLRTPWALAKKQTEIDPIDPPTEHEKILPVPKPFKRTKNGIYCTVDGVDVEVCDFDIYPVRYGKDEALGAESVHFKWYRQNVGWSDLIFPNQLLFPQAARDFVVQIGSQGILLRDAAQVGVFQTMLREYIRELRKQAALTNVYTSMGWKEDKQVFVIGDTVYKRTPEGQVTEEKVTFSHGVGTTYNDMFSTSGTTEEWVKLTRILKSLDLPIHQFALGVAFSAPLYSFTGLKGSVLSLYGETGGGKTLAQKWMQSVYGNPDILHYASNFTPNAVYHRLSLLGNLPMTIDEATKIDPDFLGDFVYSVTQGRDKARLNKNATEIAARTWALPVTMSTNISLTTKLSNAGYASEAQMLRLFEVEVPVHRVFAVGSDAGREIHQFISSNYGSVGREYIKYLMSLGTNTIKKDVEQAIKDFPTLFGFTFSGTERYWEQLIVLAYVGLTYAKRSGLIMFDVEPSIQEVIRQIHAARGTLMESKRDVFDLISAFCNEHSDSAVTAMYTAGVTNPVIDPTHQPRNGVYIRYNLSRTKVSAPFTRGVLILHAGCFKQWLAAQGVDNKTFMTQLTEAGVNLTPPKVAMTRYSLSKGTGIRAGQVYTVRISMNHERLASMLGETVETGDDEMSAAPIRLAG